MTTLDAAQQALLLGIGSGMIIPFIVIVIFKVAFRALKLLYYVDR